MKRDVKAIFIGASAGGISAIQKILAGLPRKINLPIVIVQHLPADSIVDPSLVFGQSTQARLQEVNDKMPIENGSVYFAPPGYHLLIEKDHTFSLSQDAPVNFSRPSIDVLFESAAVAYGAEACGVLLTGANNDGAAGLDNMQQCGALTVVQDPKDADAPVMPKSALDLFRPHFVGTLGEITEFLTKFVRGDA